MSRISDHFPYFIFLDSLKVKRIKAPKTIKIQLWNAECIHQFKTELNNANIYDSLGNSLATNPTQNLNILNHAISQAKRKHMPSRIVKFNKHKHNKSTWITNGILRSISYTDKLYLELKSTFQNYLDMVIYRCILGKLCFLVDALTLLLKSTISFMNIWQSPDNMALSSEMSAHIFAPQ